MLSKRSQSLAQPGTEQTVIADLHKTSGENVLQEAADELPCTQGTAFFFPAFGVTISKSHLILIQFQDAVITDGHPEDVRCQVFQSALSGTHRFTVHHPVLFPEPGRNLWVDSLVSQSLMKLASKETRKGSHW